MCQRVLENAPPEYVEPALDELLDAVDELVVDAMGNYVIQHILTVSGDRYAAQRARLVTAVKRNLLLFATHKFASNVVEKMLSFGDAAARREIVALMLEPAPPLSPPPWAGPGPTLLMHVMMVDLFANYVTQRCLAVADVDQLVRLVAVVRASAPELRRMTYGKHILAACEKACATAGLA